MSAPTEEGPAGRRRRLRAPRSLQARVALAVGVAVTLLWLIGASLTARVLVHEMSEVFDAALVDAAQRMLPLALRSTRHDRAAAAAAEGAATDDLPAPSAAPPAREGFRLRPFGRDRDRDHDRRHGDDDDDHARDDHAHDDHDDDDHDKRVARLHRRDDAFAFVVRDADGAVILRSAYGADDLPPFTREGFSVVPGYRVYADRSGREGATIVVAEPLIRRAHVAGEMMLRLVSPLLVILPLCLAAIFLAVRSSLDPVRRLRQELSDRGARNMSPVAADGLPSELRPVTESLNSLLARLRAAFEAERSFAANAAHELRTPVAGAIAQAQRLRSETADPEAARRAAEIESTLKRLNALSEKLMQMARAEGAQLRSERPQDMGMILRLIAEDFERLGARLDLVLPETAVRSDLDPDAFGILCRNLIENALRHGSDSDPVRVELTASGMLMVTNDGPPVPPAEMARLTRRFARAGMGPGTGLGLAIVKTIAERTGGALAFASPVPGRATGFQVRFTLPDVEMGPAAG
ncbi:sensor histidine kinase [Phaeovulum vinaykumarii]|uniref:histidine kinase n=1 Tax=Phaeovulum vinaykumarii TaxID=407234 RepID=A0A1N7M822_9RHOB|nr:ATP-binding protein [Phaeovulum vinaykumarii]SIS82224.1 two-component system, OmpR family, sensor kinase [Phaeovulum vinaykumarii]SOC11116.1 two-component system OmpR family sensor kinase [Phaeovulum vinaykumarii]